MSVTRPPARSRNRSRSLTQFAQEPLLLLALSVAALYYGRAILIPLAMALTLHFLLAPAVALLERARLPRVPAVLVTVALIFALMASIGWVVARQLVQVANDLPSYRLNIRDKISSLHLPTTGPLGTAVASLSEVEKELSSKPAPTQAIESARNTRRAREARHEAGEKQPTPVVIVPAPVSDLAYLRSLAITLLRPLGTAGMVFIFTLYMLLKREDLRNRLLLLAGMGHMNVMAQAMNDAATRISRYLVINAVVNATYGVVVGIGLYLLHVPYATLWGALAGILRLVPYAGTLAGGIMPVSFALAVFDSWGPPLYVLLLIALLEAVLSNFLEPWLYGNHTGISSLALVTTAVVWTLLWGIPGLVLSTPLTVCLIVMGRHIPQLSFLHILLGDEAELAPEAHFYERLLAMDQAEARAIADKFLETRPMADLYDTVVLPALALAEQDRHKGALEDSRASFLFQSATELIAEMADNHAVTATAPDSTLPRSRACAVVCVPAADQADEIAATMLAQLLERLGHKTMLLPAAALAPEVLNRIGQERDTVVFLSALPPFAFARARSLALRIREHLPENRLLVGLWASSVQADPSLTGNPERFGAARPEAVVRSLTQAIRQIGACTHEGLAPATQANAAEAAAEPAVQA